MIGGQKNTGETPLDALIREFNEETNKAFVLKEVDESLSIIDEKENLIQKFDKISTYKKKFGNTIVMVVVTTISKDTANKIKEIYNQKPCAQIGASKDKDTQDTGSLALTMKNPDKIFIDANNRVNGWFADSDIIEFIKKSSY